MALTPQPLFRAQDVGTSTVLGPTVPRNWRTKSNKIGDLTDANPNAAKPRYTPAGAAADWAGGAYGDDVAQAQATVALADKNGGPNQANYGPRNQGDLSTLLGMPIAVDIGRRRGGIGPKDPYPDKNTAAVAAPTVTLLTPATGVSGPNKPVITVKVTGTGFTVWSVAYVANQPYASKYISPTEMWVPLDPKQSFPGTATIAIMDHGVLSTSATFTWT